MTQRDCLRLVARLCARTAAGQGGDRDTDLGLAAVTDDDLASLLAIGRENRCLALLAPVLGRLSGERAREVDQVVAVTWAAHQLTAATLGPVFRRADAAGVPVIVYKGAAHAVRYYREPWRRQMQDIDVLVDASDGETMQGLLVEAGYHLLTTPRRARSVELGHERTFLSDKEGVRIVDLHIHPAPPHRHPFDPAALFARSRPARLFDAPVRVLAPEDELIVAAVNQAYDHFRGSLLRAVDGALLMDREPVDWNRLLEAARQARARVACWVTLRWMKHLVDADVPDEVIEALRPDPGRTMWLGVMLGSPARPAPRFQLPRRVEQVLLTLPLMDDASGFWSYAARHSVRRVIDVWRALASRGES